MMDYENVKQAVSRINNRRASLLLVDKSMISSLAI